MTQFLHLDGIQSMGPVGNPATGATPRETVEGALRQLLRRMGNSPSTSSAAVEPAGRQEVLQILGRHEGAFAGNGRTIEDVKKMAADASLAPDLRRAAGFLAQDKAQNGDASLFSSLDRAKGGRVDGRIAQYDINQLQQAPEAKELALKSADYFSRHYVPSSSRDVTRVPPAPAKPDTGVDGQETQTEGPVERPIERNDAMKEMFRYSDGLPTHTTRATLQQIADGTYSGATLPPQLVAAARFYTQHPDLLAADTGIVDRVPFARRDSMLVRFTERIAFDPNQTAAIDTIGANRKVFFGKGYLTDSRLKEIADDASQPGGVRDTARLLARDPMLFSMLDNGKHGYGGNVWNSADDRRIGEGDFDRFREKRANSAKLRSDLEIENNRTVVNDRKAAYDKEMGGAATDESIAGSASLAMQEGVLNQPAQKQEKGGGLKRFLGGLLDVGGKIFGVFSGILGGIAKAGIPLISWAAGGASIMTSAVSTGLNLGSAAIREKDMKTEGIKGAVGFLGSVAGLLIPGASKAVSAGAESIAGLVAKSTVTSVAKQGLKDAGGSMLR